jgi:hypothetical protein
MSRSLRFRLFAVGLAAGAVVCSFGPAPPVRSADDPAPGRALYHADAKHLWNRLHEALLVRTGPDGREYGRDRLEPLLWSETNHLLEERSRDRLLAVLAEFVKDKGETLIDDPLKRAVLQHDLWLVFNWLDRHDDKPPRRPVRRPLAAVIGRLALTPDEIKKLPDNYAAALASGEFPKKYDPEKPDRAYLPDLFAADGPWVCVGPADGPVAPAHLSERGGNVFTNSAFLVFLKLPAGRAATVEYLKKLRDFDGPLLVKAEAGSLDKFFPNPKLPPLPVGTEVALVRRALLIATTNAPVASPLTESVQLRVYREVPEMTAKTLDAALGGGTAANRRAQETWQSFHEVRLSRALLFAGKAGGLRPVGSDERDFKTGFNAHPWDEFEQPLRPDQSFPQRSQQFTIKESCFACHSFPGVYSFNSHFNYRIANTRDGDNCRAAALAEVSPVDADRAAVKWKEGRPNWTALKKLLAE